MNTFVMIGVIGLASMAARRRFSATARAIAFELGLEWQVFSNRAVGHIEDVPTKLHIDGRAVVVLLDADRLPAGLKTYGMSGRPEAPSRPTGDLEFDAESSWEPTNADQIGLMTSTVRQRWVHLCVTGTRFHLVDRHFHGRFAFVDPQLAAKTVRDMVAIARGMHEAAVRGPQALVDMALNDPIRQVRHRAFDVLVSDAQHANAIQSMVEPVAKSKDANLRLRVYLAAQDRSEIEREVTRREADDKLLAHAEDVLARLPNPTRY